MRLADVDGKAGRDAVIADAAGGVQLAATKDENLPLRRPILQQRDSIGDGVCGRRARDEGGGRGMRW